MREVAAPGRWIWRASGLLTTAALVAAGTVLITSAGQGQNGEPQATVTRTVTVPQLVTGLAVQSYGGPVEVTAAPVRRVQITETLTYDRQAGPPAVAQSVSGGRLSVGDPACTYSDCSVSFSVTVPPDVTATVASGGGQVTVSGIAGANLDSDGGPVRATEISGPLTVGTDGGPLLLDGLAGPLLADTWGGSLSARGLASATASLVTGGGDASVVFSAAPDTVTMSTDGGAAGLDVPGGPYALIADSDGGPLSVRIAADPAAHRSITVISNGGPLVIRPLSARLSASAGRRRPADALDRRRFLARCGQP